MKMVFALAVLLSLGAGGYYYWKQSPKHEAASNPAERETTAVAEPRDIRFAVTAAGEISPADQVSVRPEVNGRIAELPVDLGDKVKKGALLCRLDDQDLQIERSGRLTEIDGAKLQLQKSNRAFARAKQLIADKLIAQEVFEDAKTEHDLATNSLERAEKSLRLIEDRLTKTKILAPFDCTVLTRPVSVGQTVSGSGGFNAGTEIMSIANLNEMIINAHINQADVIRLQHGQPVDVQVESVPGLKLAGVVERIAPQAVIRNGIKGFSARVFLKNIDPVIRPGMTALLNIPIAAVEDVLSIPLSAVFTEQGERFAYVKNGEGFERRSITIGLSDYSHAEVQSGLTAGDVVSLEQPTDVLPEKSRDQKQPGDQRQRRDRTGASASIGTAQAPAPAAAKPINGSANSRPLSRASGS